MLRPRLQEIFAEWRVPFAACIAEGQRAGEIARTFAPHDLAEFLLSSWRFPNELPIEGELADVYATMESAHAALLRSTYPKLLFAADPGALVSPAQAEEFAAKLTNCRLIKLGDGVHFLQEDHPEAIGRSVAGFIADIEAAKARSAA